MLLDNKESFYGGAAGGGKSDCLLMCGLQHVDIKGYAGIIFRKNYSDLVKPGALIDRSKEWLSQFPEVRWVEKEKKFEFLEKYGTHTDIKSILQFGYLETDNDRFNYQGGEYQYIGFDELTHMSEICYKYMFSRMRRLKGVEIPLRVRSASNPPDDDQGQWVYDRFVNPEKKRKGAVFISAGLDDNPYLDKEEYVQSLEELDPVTRARLRDGLWTVVRKGNMFKSDWFEYVDSPPVNRRRVRFWDMASTQDPKKKKNSHDPDYTCGFLLSEAKGIYYIEDIIRVRKRPADTNALQKSTATSDGYRTVIYEEQEPGSSGDTTIDMKARDIFKGFNYHGVRSTGSKILRANAASAASERGHIKIVRGCRNIEAFLAEAESFPGGLHDDMVDGLSGAFQALASLPKSYAPLQLVNSEGSYWATDGDTFMEDVSGYWGAI
jgi:predicted phage terminase large subunit-like protein